MAACYPFQSLLATLLYEALVFPFLPGPWSGEKLTAFHRNGGVTLVLLVLREVEGVCRHCRRVLLDTGQHVIER